MIFFRIRDGGQTRSPYGLWNDDIIYWYTNKFVKNFHITAEQVPLCLVWLLRVAPTEAMANALPRSVTPDWIHHPSFASLCYVGAH